MMKRNPLALLTASAAIALVSACAHAQESRAAHPGYLHALQDLRFARAQLERMDTPAVEQDERMAIAEIDAAIGEIKRASIDDGKDLYDHPPVDAHVTYTDRFHRAIEALKQARGDCEHEEDNGFARGLQGRAIQHIDLAIRASRHAIGDALQ